MYAKKTSKKVIVVLLIVVLLLGCAVGGTMAWLIAESGTVSNTFSVGDITLELKEHALENGVLNQNKETDTNTGYKVLPGTEQPKDPFVRVVGGSEACWLFVKITETNNAADATTALKYVNWEIDDGIWTPVIGETNLYYRICTAKAEDQPFDILKDDRVTYAAELTKEMISKLGNNAPSLTFQAYAIQSEGLSDSNGEISTANDTDAARAWKLINP